jgi:hypothetical protein
MTDPDLLAGALPQVASASLPKQGAEPQLANRRRAMKTSTMIVLLAGAGACAMPARTGSGSPTMSFFITSNGPGLGADLGGLAGADTYCNTLAQTVGVGSKTWRAYLSTQSVDGGAQVNARDRIGSGPWYNAKGVQVATSVANLHSDNNALSKANSLNEKGEVVNGRGDTPNRHDILTGTQLDGTAFPPGEDKTCSNWTARGAGSAQVGHFDRQGGGQNPTSWNSAHPSSGCSQQNLRSTGGDGLFYCFAI